jgi:hypothetical protein
MSLPALIRSPLVLWANSSKNVLHDAWQSNGTLDSVRLTQGDTIAVELHWVTDVAASSLIHDEVIWPSAANVTLALGRIDAAPEAGVFSLSYGGQTTADIPFNASGSQIASALNALTSVSAEGGVTAIKTGTIYKVVWNSAGALASSLAVVSNDLLPQSTIGISLARAGSPTVAGIYSLHIKQAPVAACTVWETPNPAEISVELETEYAGIGKTWLLSFDKMPRGGSFNLRWVSATGVEGISWKMNISTLSVESITRDLAAASGFSPTWFLSVFERSPTSWAIDIRVSTNAPGSVPPVMSLTPTRVTLYDFSTKAGLLSLNTLEVEGMLAGQTSVDVVMEIEVEMGGERRTIAQAQAYIVNDLIDTDVYDLVQWGDVLPADSVVRFDTAQVLTSGQQLQVRNNIGALGASSLNALIADIDNLELLLGGVSLTTNELAAVKGAALPSATNLFLTKSAADALYAELAHEHLPADIIGLQAALDAFETDIGAVQAAVTGLTASKANTYHVQPTSTVTGLDTILADFDTRIAGFAQINHTHDVADIVDLEGRLSTLETFQTNKEPNVPSTAQKASLNNAENPTALNPLVTESRLTALLGGATTGFATQLYVDTAVTTATNLLPNQYLSSQGNFPTSVTGNLTATVYNLELTIFQNGVNYTIPARLT